MPRGVNRLRYGTQFGQRFLQPAAVGENVAVGEYRVVWDGKDDAGNPQSSGAYFYRFRVGRQFWSNKMVLVR